MEFINSVTEKFNNKQINNLATKYNVQPYIIKHLFTKGIKSDKEINMFLNPGISQFYNPFLLKGINEAIKLINNAINDDKRIVIVGDYDTDGICATAILYKYFESKNKIVNYFLPNRFLDGYGLTIETVDKIIDLYNPELIITVDCGISCYKEIDYIKSKNINVIVTDHHEIPINIPKCICIDPKFNDQSYPFNNLCGAGVALKLVQALGGLDEYLKYCNIATLATVADIVPLIDENRALVKYGLTQAGKLPIGVKKLLQTLKIKDLTSTDIAFKLAPKLNTAGRMGDASLSFQLFIEEDNIKINKYIKELINQNEERIKIGNTIYDECIELLKDVNISQISAIVLQNDNWHSGVLGIVCAKLTELYNRPVCLLTKVDNIYKGSVRSIKGIDIYKELEKVEDLLIRFGGHSGAGGISISKDNIESFKNRLNNNIKNTYNISIFNNVKYYDIDANKEKINVDYVKNLEILEPFGFGNEKPLFKFSFNNIKPERIKNHPNYYKIKTENFELLTFNHDKHFMSLLTNCNKEVLIDLSVDTYKNKDRLKGIIKYINYQKLNTTFKLNEVNGYYAYQLKKPLYSFNPIITQINDLNNFKQNINKYIGTLFVCNSFESYLFVINEFKDYIINYDTYSIKYCDGSNTLLYCPNSFDNFINYENIIFFDEILNIDYLKNFNSKIYLYLYNKNSCICDLSTNRHDFAIYHRAIKSSTKLNQVSYSVIDYFNTMKRLNPQFKNLKFNQFIFVTMVLEELNILSITDQINSFSIKINNNIVNPLNNSKIYNYVTLLKKCN